MSRSSSSMLANASSSNSSVRFLVLPKCSPRNISPGRIWRSARLAHESNCGHNGLHVSTDHTAAKVVAGSLGGAAQSATPGSSRARRSEEHTSELQSLMRTSYAVFCFKKKKNSINKPETFHTPKQCPSPATYC